MFYFHLKAVASDKSCDHTNVSWFSPRIKTGKYVIINTQFSFIINIFKIPGTGVSLNGVMDFVVYLGILHCR